MKRLFSVLVVVVFLFMAGMVFAGDEAPNAPS